MPQPTSAALHTSVPLTNISIAYQQNQNFIADRVFPIVSVQKQGDLFYKYLKGEWFRTVAEERAPGTETVGTGWNVTSDSYYARVYGVHKDIDDQARANADSQFNLDRDATQLVTNDLLLKREIQWMSTYFASGVWGTTTTGTSATSSVPSSGFTQFNVAGVDPITTVATQALAMQKSTGYKPNTFVVTPEVDLALKSHASILDRIKYTQRGFVSEDLLASAFGVDRYLVSASIKNTATETSNPSATGNTSMDWVTPEGALLCYTAPNPGLLTVSAGYTFAWSGMFNNAFGTRVKRFRLENIASDRIEAEFAYDMKVIASDLGIFFSNPLQP